MCVCASGMTRQTKDFEVALSPGGFVVAQNPWSHGDILKSSHRSRVRVVAGATEKDTCIQTEHRGGFQVNSNWT